MALLIRHPINVTLHVLKHSTAAMLVWGPVLNGRFICVNTCKYVCMHNAHTYICRGFLLILLF